MDIVVNANKQNTANKSLCGRVFNFNNLRLLTGRVLFLFFFFFQ